MVQSVYGYIHTYPDDTKITHSFPDIVERQTHVLNMVLSLLKPDVVKNEGQKSFDLLIGRSKVLVIEDGNYLFGFNTIEQANKFLSYSQLGRHIFEFFE